MHSPTSNLLLFGLISAYTLVVKYMNSMNQQQLQNMEKIRSVKDSDFTMF